MNFCVYSVLTSFLKFYFKDYKGDILGRKYFYARKNCGDRKITVYSDNAKRFAKQRLVAECGALRFRNIIEKNQVQRDHSSTIGM